MLTRSPAPQSEKGFSLIELMVGSVIGLIVIGAVIALVLSMVRSNRQNLQSTRLNQELRATLAVIANDIKRARSLADPLSAATAAAGNPYEVVDSSTAGCIRYAYAGGAGGDWRSIRRNTATQRIVFSTGSAAASATCTSTGVELGSTQVAITALEIQPQVSSSTARRLDITVTGRLNDPDSELSGISRTMRQTVFIRSIGDGT